MDEKEIMNRIAQGDKDAFHQLYREAAAAVYGFAFSIVKNRHTAEDILQDTFIRVRETAARYRDDGKLMAWIIVIARNLATDSLRQNNRFVSDGEKSETAPAASPDGEIETKIVLREAMRALSDDERQIIILHAVSGLKHREIAASLNKPLATVLSQYRRSLKKLHKTLKFSFNERS